MLEFKDVDFYDIDDLLSEEERLTRDSFRNFVSDKLMPVIVENYHAGQFPTDLVNQLS